jgi:hypothetical protein
MVRSSAILLILAGLTLSCLNLRDEIRGETSVYSPGIATSTSWIPKNASEDQKNSNFRGAMTYQWVYAILLVAAGAFGLSLCRSADKTDPFSSTFNWPDEKK